MKKFERSTKPYQQEDKSCVIKIEGLSFSGCAKEYWKAAWLIHYGWIYFSPIEKVFWHLEAHGFSALLTTASTWILMLSKHKFET